MKPINIVLTLVLILIFTGCSSGDISVNSIRIVLPESQTQVVKNIIGVFEQQLQKRCPVKVKTEGRAQLKIILKFDPGIGKEGFRIESSNKNIIIVGNDEPGLLYGLGKLLRTGHYSNDGFAPGNWRGQFVPEKPIRGIYFATHFHNYYHEAPADQVKQYVEELALWGINTLIVWYDMHHFNGFNDPKAVEFRDRLYSTCKAAKDIGLDIGFIAIANEAYNNSPEELRVGADVNRGGWYDCAVCPEKKSKDGQSGINYILKILGEEFDWIAPLQPEFMVVWPYDQGGCACDKCYPWGSNGFMRTGATISELAKEKLPGIKIIASTWYMNNDEWEGMAKYLKEENFWADIILSEGNIRKLDETPMVGFPEISMHGMFPWGGFGASVLAKRVENQWNMVKEVSDGGFPYSEGIYEDITKIVYSQLFWNNRPYSETLREYIAYEFGEEHVDKLLQVMKRLEQNHHFRWWPGQMDGTDFPQHWIPNKDIKPQEDPGAEEAWAIVEQVDKDLPEWARSSWRWRILFLRAFLDAELKANNGIPNTKCNKAFKELIEIYHAQNADPVIRPPLPRN